MRHIAFLLIVFFSFNGLAQKSSIEGASQNEVAAPVLIDSRNGDEAHVGVFTAEATEQKPDALSILRRDLQRQAMLEQAKSQKDGVFMSTNKRFAPESITFFIAIGGVTFNSMWIKSHGDPLAMERHILSLKDPIAHLSFYAFMQSQGFYMDFRTKSLNMNAMDATTRKQMMTRLSYQGMAIGSLAASIIADLGQSVKMCTDSWINGKSDEKSLTSCDQAWAQWTVRKKFTQYFPQIISLWAAQAATSFVETGAFKTFEVVSKTSFFQKILTKDYLVKTAYKITGADVALTFAGGGWAMKSIKFVGKVTKFSLFVGVDHFLSNYTYRPLNNLIRPLFFDFDALAINSLWYQADLGNWENDKLKSTAPIEKFEKEIENYGVQMQQWREHLNSDAEADLAGWMEMTKRILNQIDYAYKYYHGFADSLHQTLNVNFLIQNKQLAPSASEIISNFPMRTLPFYGISTGPYKAIGGQIEDYYLLNPNEMEKRQKEHILNTAQKFKNLTNGLRKGELRQFNEIIEKLLSLDNNKMASGLNDLNKSVQIDQVYVTATATYEDISGYSAQFQDLIYQLKRELGSPQPVVYPLAGYSQAFAANSVNKVVAESAEYGKWSVYNKYNFNKEADMMLYKLVCGQESGSLYKIQLAGVNFFSPQFDPPSLLKKNSDRQSFCNSRRSTNDLYSTSIAGKSLTQYLLDNLDYSAVGDYTKSKDNALFEKWWQIKVKLPLNPEFKKFDADFKKLTDLAYNNYFDHRTFFKFVVDGLNQSKYLPKSLNASIRAESRLYLQILARAMMSETPNIPNSQILKTLDKNTMSDYEKTKAWLLKNGSPVLLMRNYMLEKQLTEFNYLEFATKSSEEMNYISLYGKIPKDLEKLELLLAAYPSFINSADTNFESYIAHSKKIDTAVNDILVALGLKKLVSTQNTDQPEDLSNATSPSATGNENSEKIYEDVQIANPTYKQRMAISALKGIRMVESEIRRFIRMKIMLAQGLELDSQEFMKDWNNANPTQLNSSKPKNMRPFGN